MQIIRPFYLVWNIGGDSPKYQHENYASAHREAERLARENKGKRFVVLQSVEYVESSDTVTVTLREDDHPF